MSPPSRNKASVFQYQVFDKPFQYQTFDRITLRPISHPIGIPAPHHDRIKWSPRYTDDSLQSEDRGGTDDEAYTHDANDRDDEADRSQGMEDEVRVEDPVDVVVVDEDVQDQEPVDTTGVDDVEVMALDDERVVVDTEVEASPELLDEADIIDPAAEERLPANNDDDHFSPSEADLDVQDNSAPEPIIDVVDDATFTPPAETEAVDAEPVPEVLEPEADAVPEPAPEPGPQPEAPKDSPRDVPSEKGHVSFAKEQSKKSSRKAPAKKKSKSKKGKKVGALAAKFENPIEAVTAPPGEAEVVPEAEPETVAEPEAVNRAEIVEDVPPPDDERVTEAEDGTIADQDVIGEVPEVVQPEPPPGDTDGPPAGEVDTPEETVPEEAANPSHVDTEAIAADHVGAPADQETIFTDSDAIEPIVLDEELVDVVVDAEPAEEAAQAEPIGEHIEDTADPPDEAQEVMDAVPAGDADGPDDSVTSPEAENLAVPPDSAEEVATMVGVALANPVTEEPVADDEAAGENIPGAWNDGPPMADALSGTAVADAGTLAADEAGIDDLVTEAGGTEAKDLGQNIEEETAGSLAEEEERSEVVPVDLPAEETVAETEPTAEDESEGATNEVDLAEVEAPIVADNTCLEEIQSAGDGGALGGLHEESPEGATLEAVVQSGDNLAGEAVAEDVPAAVTAEPDPANDEVERAVVGDAATGLDTDAVEGIEPVEAAAPSQVAVKDATAEPEEAADLSPADQAQPADPAPESSAATQAINGGGTDLATGALALTTAASAAAALSTTPTSPSKSSTRRRRHRRRDSNHSAPDDLNGHRTQLVRSREEKGAFTNAYSRAIDKAKLEAERQGEKRERRKRRSEKHAYGHEDKESGHVDKAKGKERELSASGDKHGRSKERKVDEREKTVDTNDEPGSPKRTQRPGPSRHSSERHGPAPWRPSLAGGTHSSGGGGSFKESPIAPRPGILRRILTGGSSSGPGVERSGGHSGRLLLVRFNEDDDSNRGGNVKAQKPSSTRSTSSSGKRRDVRKDERADAAVKSIGIEGDKVEQQMAESEREDQAPVDDASLDVPGGEQAVADAERENELEVLDSAAVEEEATVPQEAGADVEAVPPLDDTAEVTITPPGTSPAAAEEAPSDMGGNEEAIARTEEQRPPRSTTTSSSTKRTRRPRDHDRTRHDKMPSGKGDRSIRTGRLDHDLRREQRYHGEDRRRREADVAPIVRIGRAMRMLVR
ncbi:uncharacterized protein AB675_7686 [Cyphellophora attinorum]|uniref:Uncharacterized protein n=1 Tax=Cyphellophora attinorum TaxID=1664694 RepID=A0A0N1H9L7_9EURO|nr:uncharacterized protein AB675_7686 [Phialophora attinorum]KPI40266.1 hypothetical protein AB675_7686 [Phialophora attinorum]